MSSSPTAVVAEANDAMAAQIWVDALRDEGIRAASFEQSVGGALGGATTNFARYPIVVAETDLLAARNVIARIAGASALAPIPDREAERGRQARIVLIAAIVIAAVLVFGVLNRVIAG
jgi:hypothetical protein